MLKEITSNIESEILAKNADGAYKYDEDRRKEFANKFGRYFEDEKIFTNQHLVNLKQVVNFLWSFIKANDSLMNLDYISMKKPKYKDSHSFVIEENLNESIRRCRVSIYFKLICD